MNVKAPARIGKSKKVIQYGYLPEAVMPSEQALAQGPPKPIQNIAICEFGGKYVPTFCTENWQPVPAPAGFGPLLEQNDNPTLEQAKRIPLELLGVDVIAWYDMPQVSATDFYGEKLEQPNSVEALSWLQEEEAVFRTFGGNGIRRGFDGKRAISFIKRLYRSGAVKVTAIEVQRDRYEGIRQETIKRGLPETDLIEATDSLIVELPEDTQAREALIQQWISAFGRKKWDVPVDTGQQYLYFRWD